MLTLWNLNSVSTAFTGSRTGTAWQGFQDSADDFIGLSYNAASKTPRSEAAANEWWSEARIDILVHDLIAL
jgi:hypothetical protein